MGSATRLISCRLPVSRHSLIRYGRTLGFSDLDAASVALARSIAASPAWASKQEAAVVVRPGREPILAIMGRFDQREQAWLEAQSQALESLCRGLRRVGYPQVEEDCGRLAAMLSDRLGDDQLGEARFAAIPRGGFVVLGLLAITLGLERRQLEPPYPPQLPLVVVDDCAMSGSRFRGFLNRHERHRKIVFAHLYSHPELRAAIERREPRVAACISAADLESAGDGFRDGADRARFLEKLDGAYWIGATAYPAFPWGEPDRLIWHPGEERLVAAWRLVPPELCLKNQGRRGIPVEIQPEAKGPLAPGREVIFGELQGRVVLLHLERRESSALDDVASDVWRALIRHGSVAAIVDEMGGEYRVSKDRLRRDVSTLVQQLIDRGFLKRGGSSSGPASRA